MMVICQNQTCNNEFEIDEILKEGTIMCECSKCETKMIFSVSLDRMD